MHKDFCAGLAARDGFENVAKMRHGSIPCKQGVLDPFPLAMLCAQISPAACGGVLLEGFPARLNLVSYYMESFHLDMKGRAPSPEGSGVLPVRVDYPLRMPPDAKH